MEQKLTTIYRTQEDKVNFTFVSAVFITYFGDVAMVSGLDTPLTTKCWRELYDHFEKEGIKQVQYYRKGRLKVVWIDSGL